MRTKLRHQYGGPINGRIFNPVRRTLQPLVLDSSYLFGHIDVIIGSRSLRHLDPLPGKPRLSLGSRRLSIRQFVSVASSSLVDTAGWPGQ